LLDPLRKVIVIRQHHHLVVVIHVPKHKLQILLLPRDHLLAHWKGLMRVLRGRLLLLVQELTFTLVKTVD
jgi:hypothetical protein